MYLAQREELKDKTKKSLPSVNSHSRHSSRYEAMASGGGSPNCAEGGNVEGQSLVH